MINYLAVFLLDIVVYLATTISFHTITSVNNESSVMSMCFVWASMRKGQRLYANVSPAASPEVHTLLTC